MMDDRQKRNIAFGLLLLILITSSIFFFVFNNFLNKGTLIIDSSPTIFPPITVFEERTGYHSCEEFPCEIKLFAGQRYLKIEKEGYKEKNEIVKINFLGKTEIKIDMKLNPYLEISNLILEEKEIPYELIFEKDSSRQILVNTKDPLQKAIAYFPKIIEDPKYYLNEPNLLIIDKNGDSILINTQTGTRSQVIQIPRNIKDISISPDNNYFAFNLEDNLLIFNNESKTLPIYTQINLKNKNYHYQFDTYNNLYLLKQDLSDQQKTTIVKQFSTRSFEEMVIFETKDITSIVTQILITPFGNDMLIKSEDLLYRLVLK